MLHYRTEIAIWDGMAVEVWGGVMTRAVITETPETVTVLGLAVTLPHLLVRIRRAGDEIVTVERSSLTR